MRLRPIRTITMQRIHEPEIPQNANRSFVREARPDPEAELSDLLFAPSTDRSHGTPSISELTAGLTSLARGLRRKVLLPLPHVPIEFALVRRDGRVLVSIYETASAPEVHQLDHPVDLATLLEACARAALEDAQLKDDPVARQIAVRTAERARRTTLAPDPASSARAERHAYGIDEDTDEPLTFAFEARIHPESGLGSAGASGGRATSSADVHALLFEGTLTARVRGRRLVLSRGPIVLAAQRMVVAVRALIDGWEAGRPLNVRLRTGAFGVGVRLDRQERAELLLHAQGENLRAAELHPEEIALPVLRLASELLRALVRTDRTQARNLRVTALRDELRALRKAVKGQRGGGFTHGDPEGLALSLAGQESKTSPGCVSLEASRGGIRYEERWRVDLGGLDAGATFFCGDRLVLATPEHTLAVERTTGEVIWAREGGGSLLMAGRTLVRSQDGDVELCDVGDGEPYALARVVPRVGGREVAVSVGGGDVPPMAVLAEGTSRLVALDTRTGEPRWRFAAAGTRFELTRLGRLLLVATDSTIHALDVATGEELWRHVGRARYAWAPVIQGDTVIAVSAGRHGRLVGISLGSGEVRYERSLEGSVRAAPIAVGGVAVIAVGRSLEGREPRTGERLWTRSDPGIGDGAATLDVDGLLVANVPGGRALALESETGETRWMRPLGDPLADEVPRRLEPVLRGAALFVPAAGVFILRPSDGEVLGEIDCDLVPDRVRVDERGWVYVAEESGHLAAYGPATAPQLRMIRGGKG